MQGFLIRSGGVFLILLSLLALFNWFIDPFYDFREDRIIGVNDRFPASVPPRARIKQLKESPAEKVIIGTSKTYHGFDKKNEDIFNVAMSGGSLEQILYVISEDIKNIKKRNGMRQYYIELVSVHPEEINNSILHKLLSLQSLNESIQLYLLSYRYHNEGKEFDLKPIQAGKDFLSDSLLKRVGVIGINDSVKIDRPALDNILLLCSGANVEINFYNPPYPQRVMDYAGVTDSIFKQNRLWQQFFSMAREKYPDCNLHYFDFTASDNDWLDEGNHRQVYATAWYDHTHFTPELGKILLEEMR